MNFLPTMHFLSIVILGVLAFALPTLHDGQTMGAPAAGAPASTTLNPSLPARSASLLPGGELVTLHTAPQQCSGCGASTAGTTSGTSAPCPGGGTAVSSIVAGIVQHGECTPSCATNKTCRFSFSVSVAIVGACLVRYKHDICTVTESPPYVCSNYTSWITGSFISESSGFDIVCARQEIVNMNVVNDPNGSGPSLGTLVMTCNRCIPQ